MNEYELVMPFVTVASVGGPHDDDSYVAGFEVGQIDAELRLGASNAPACSCDVSPFRMTVRTQNLPQLDLVAMRHGWRMVIFTTLLDEWTEVLFDHVGLVP